jgi:hypothetical protein
MQSRRAGANRCLALVVALGLAFSTLAFAGTAAASPSRAKYCGAATWAPTYYSVKNVSCREALKLLKVMRWGYSNKITIRGWKCRVMDKSQVIVNGYPVGQGGARCSRETQRVFIGYGE